MEDLKIYGLNLGAIFISVIDNINPYLQTIVMVTSISYTLLKMYQYRTHYLKCIKTYQRMAKIDIDGDGKADFSISLPNIVMIVGGIVSIVSSYYMLDAKIQKAMVSPPQEVSQKDLKYLKDEEDLKIDKLEKQIEDNKELIKSLELELRNNYKRR
jgi:hypothetical protein